MTDETGGKMTVSQPFAKKILLANIDFLQIEKKILAEKLVYIYMYFLFLFFCFTFFVSNLGFETFWHPEFLRKKNKNLFFHLSTMH